MALLTVRVGDNPDEWPDERIGALVGHATQLGDVWYPVTDGRRDDQGAVLVIDTGDTGPTLARGASTQLGPVE